MAKIPIETLVPDLVHEEQWRRMRATAACLAGGPRAVHALVQALEGGDSALKIEAAGLLARLKDPKGGVPLVRLLQDQDEAVRTAAAQALEQMAGIVDLETAAVLVYDLRRVTDDQHRVRLVRLVGVIPNAIEPLTAMLRHEDPQARVMAATMLEQLLDPRAGDALVDAMTDPVIGEHAVRTLKKLGAVRDRIVRVFEALRDLEEAGEREEARMSAVVDLLGIGRPSVEILIEYLDDEDWLLREAAADLLGKIGDVRAVEPLMKRLREDKDAGVKELAVKALGLIGDARPADLLIELIPIRPLRVVAVEALAKIRDVERLASHRDLFRRLQTDRDGLVSYSAGVIVNKLDALAAEAEQVASRGGADEHA